MSKRRLTEGYDDYSELVDSLAERAYWDVEEGNDATDAALYAIDEGLIYYNDQWTVVHHFMSPADILSENSEVYEDLYSDVCSELYKIIESHKGEKDEDEDDGFEESFKPRYSRRKLTEVKQPSRGKFNNRMPYGRR